MASFITIDILRIFQKKLTEELHRDARIIREYTYVDKPLPFMALHMGKKNDEYFLDSSQNKIKVKALLDDLDQLLIKKFNSIDDLCLEHKQAKKAKSIADIYIQGKTTDIIFELEVFKDKPFSNLIYIPEVCKAGCHISRPLYFIHCFAPERNDKEAELTRKIGFWLQKHHKIEKFTYLPFMMPALPQSIAYLLPKKNKLKPKQYLLPSHEQNFHKYIDDYFENTMHPKIVNLLSNQ